MLAFSQVLDRIAALVPEPPGSRSRGPVDPRIDPAALAAFGVAELAHPELPLRFAFERAQDAMDEMDEWVRDGPTTSPGAPRQAVSAPMGQALDRSTTELPTIEPAALGLPAQEWTAAGLPTITELPDGWAADGRAEAEWRSAPSDTRIIRPGSAFEPGASRRRRPESGDPG
jgi:hypothetical protein